ncbi:MULTISPECIES: MATE family efflux transporter [Planktothricoides]|uniref:Probable multidrug resistance protein NorM n=1 Tax=Planktothricoides raciborskii FACHB-1370 TaxID=2949576 RepID=A0ABR8E7Z9_9CYAN|nr:MULTISPECIES: MATE family efflux transporter [Planktothricoides]MBD2542861.1 MATE family efflux transporter [Planktothricoides raciborskii FACHB-1370]MBD2581392.1 MATE family efflux transporter [Planktothricoides raciborskii FACHB-1261]
MFQYDFLNRFLKTATVNIVSNITIPLSGAISVAFLGHLSNISYLEGVALGSIVLSFLYESCSFIKSGTTVITSQAVGRNDREAILLAGIQNVLIALALGLLFLLLQYPLKQLGFLLLNATTEVKLASIAYFNTGIWGAPAVLSNLALIGWLLGREQNHKVLLLTIVGNVSNVALNYLYIVLWDWSSMGAGLSQAISQYLTLLLGILMISCEVSLKEVGALMEKYFDFSVFRTTLDLNRNLSVRAVVIVSIFVLFNAFSATREIDMLAENVLLLQIVAISMYMCDGVEYATVSLIGQFEGQGASHKFIPLLQIALATNLVIALIISLVAGFFPAPIIHLFTNHSELIDTTKTYLPWTFIVIIGSSVAYILDGYCSGLGEGVAIRNTYLVSGLLGLIFLSLATFYFHSNHFLWLALFIFMLCCILILGMQIPMTWRDSPMSEQKKEAVSN